MSHIPASAMPHAGPAHHDAPRDGAAAQPANDAAPRGSGHVPLAAVAIGGAIALGAVAIAIPLMRPKTTVKEKKAKAKRKARN